MKDFECIILILIILIVFIFIFNNGGNGKKENFEASSYVFQEGYNSKDNLMDCNIKEYENKIDKLSTICDNLDNCVGFTNKGYFKNSNDLYKDPAFNKSNEGIYIKKDYNCDFENIINTKPSNLPPNVASIPYVSPTIQGEISTSNVNDGLSQATISNNMYNLPSNIDILPSNMSNLSSMPSNMLTLSSVSYTLPSMSSTSPSMSSTLQCIPSTLLSTLPSMSSTLPSTLSSMSSTLPSISSTLPSMSSTLPSISSTLPSMSSTLPSISSTLPSMSSTLPSISSTMSSMPTTYIPTTYIPTTYMPTQTLTQLLEEKCPLSISETRNGIVYINPTNSATRDNYLFSGCNASNTCNTNQIDPISKNILDSIPSKGNCGSWDLGDYNWEASNNKWIKK